MQVLIPDQNSSGVIDKLAIRKHKIEKKNIY